MTAYWLIDIEISLAKAFNWSLFDIDQTDIESLIPFVLRLAAQDTRDRAYADEATWL